MSNIFNKDFQDFLKTLNNNDVEYILVGGYAVIIHGYSRTTGDMDIWVNRTETNYIKLKKAFAEFGMSVFDMDKENFLYHPTWDVFRFGRNPVAIDIMVKMSDFNFSECYALAFDYFENDFKIKVINYNHLIEAKQKAGRNKDKNDLEHL